MTEPDYAGDAARLGVNVTALRFAYLRGRNLGESWADWLERVTPELKARAEQDEKAADA